MKRVQGVFWTGYVRIIVKGKMPELFFQQCVRKGISVWEIKKVGEHVCMGNIRIQDIRAMRKVRQHTDYHITFSKKQGIPFMAKHFFRKKELVLGFLISLLLLFFLSNMVWNVEISGVPNDLEIKIEKKLHQYGVRPGAWGLTLESPSVIQQKLVDDIPELLWVGVNKKGTTYYLSGVEKAIVKKKKEKGPQNLVATKKGVITYMYVSRGLPKVQVHDYVKPGDILVAGKLQFDENNGDDKEDDKKIKYVTSAGEVIAETWYRVHVSVPLKRTVSTLTGNEKHQYFLKIGGLKIPVWGFGNPDYDDVYRDTTENHIHFLKWDLPITFGKTVQKERTSHVETRTNEEAVTIAKAQAKRDLLRQLGHDTTILQQKVLHESTENGKVNISLYITAEENIAKEVPIKRKSSDD